MSALAFGPNKFLPEPIKESCEEWSGSRKKKITKDLSYKDVKNMTMQIPLIFDQPVEFISKIWLKYDTQSCSIFSYDCTDTKDVDIYYQKIKI